MENNKTPSDLIAAYIFDHKNKTKIGVSKLLVIEQMQNETPIIEKSFDDLFIEDIKPISLEMAKIWALINNSVSPEKNTLQNELTPLILTAYQTIFAALQLLRMGYYLQPGILIRLAYETLSTVLYLFKYPDEINEFKKGNLKSTKTIETAKEFIPILGPAWGNLSNKFVHIGELHNALMPILPYKKKDDLAVKLNIGFLRMATIVLYSTCERVYFDFVDKPRYWTRLNDGGYKYNPSSEEQEWMRIYLLPGEEQGIGV